MKRLIAAAVAGGALVLMAACSSTPSAGPSAASSASAAPVSTDPVANTAAACKTADTIYANLDATAKAELAKGVAAGLSGDDAAAKKALDTVQPIMKAASTTFQVESDKAIDPNVKTALKTLSDEYLQASQITSIDDLDKIDTSEAEATLKSLCSESGVTLQHFE
jgi:hypothetical protein